MGVKARVAAIVTIGVGITAAVVGDACTCEVPFFPVAPELSDCSTADTSGCVAGRTLTITNAANSDLPSGGIYFRCDQNLLSETHTNAVVSGSGWPAKISIDFQPGQIIADNVFAFDPGCQGDGDPNTIDLILEIGGDGLTKGTQFDAIKIRTTSAPTGGIQLTGFANCGPGPIRAGGAVGAHQDGVQAQGGSGYTFVDFEIGDFDNGAATCQGAGGGFFYSAANNFFPTDTHLIRGGIVVCNTSFQDGNPDEATGSVTDTRFRGGRVEHASVGGTAVCEPSVPLGEPCTTGDGGTCYATVGCTSFDNQLVVKTNVDCELWNPSTDTWVDE